MSRLADVGGRLTRVAPVLRRLGREARRWGLPGAVGTLLLIAAAALVVGVFPLGREALRIDEQALRDARVAAAKRQRADEARSPVADPAQRFRAFFPSADQRHRRVTNLLALAAGLGLQPRHSDVRSSDDTSLGLTRVRVVLPLTGPYAELRRYVDQALRDDPALSLDQLRLERSDAEAHELRAELQWSLWMQPASDAALETTNRLASAAPPAGAAR